MQPTAPCSCATLGLMPRHEPPYLAITIYLSHQCPIAPVVHNCSIIWNTIIHKNKFARHIAIGRPRVVYRGSCSAVWFDVASSFNGSLSLATNLVGVSKFQNPRFRRGKERFVRFNLRLEAPALNRSRKILHSVFRRPKWWGRQTTSYRQPSKFSAFNMPSKLGFELRFVFGLIGL